MHDGEVLKAAERAKPADDAKKTNVQIKMDEKAMAIARHSLENFDRMDNKIRLTAEMDTAQHQSAAWAQG